MTPKELGQKIKELIATAKIDEAIAKMLEFFNDKEKFRTLKNKVLFIKSTYSKAKQDESLGISTREASKLSFNKTSTQLLEIADDLESGAFEQQQKIEKKKKRNTSIVIGAIAGIGLLILALVFNPFKPEEAAYNCPDFQIGQMDEVTMIPEIFPILILPFQPITSSGGIGEEATVTDLQIKKRFGTLSERVGILTDPQTINPREFALNLEEYPSSFSDAEKLGNTCNAKLIIWGTTEELQDGQKPIINRKFKFLGLGETFKMAKIQEVEGGSDIDTIETFTNIATGSEITEDIENVLMGIIAFQKQDYEKAVALLSNVETQDSATSLASRMFKAEALVAQNKNDEALEAFGKVLEIHPNYGLAANNHGMLNFWKGNYEEAIEDFNIRLDQAPTDTAVLTYRGKSFFEIGRLTQAEKDMEKVIDLKTDNQDIEERLQEVKVKIEEQRTIQSKTGASIKRAPNNIQAYLDHAKSSWMLGEDEMALESAERALEIDQNDPTAQQLFSTAATTIQDTSVLKKYVDRASRNGVRVNTILPPRVKSRIGKRSDSN